jgi:hypothetical protein
MRRHRTPALIGALVATTIALTGCAGGDDGLALGEVASLKAEAPLAVDIAVLSVTRSTIEEAKLAGLFGAAVDGVPWLVGFRLDVTEGTREDFSWETVTDLSAAAWTADAGSAGQIGATSVAGTGSEDLPCAERGQEPPASSIGYYCELFILPKDAEIHTVELSNVASWSVETE